MKQKHHSPPVQMKLEGLDPVRERPDAVGNDIALKSESQIRMRLLTELLAEQIAAKMRVSHILNG